jgi:hypothetical protein
MEAAEVADVDTAQVVDIKATEVLICTRKIAMHVDKISIA